MNKLIVLFFITFLLIPSIASAHTQLKASTPAEGGIISDELKEITLSFEEKIENLSTMKLLKDGTEIPFNQVQIQGATMKGILPEPLENGSYHIQWNIAGNDGHPITGEINFQVQREQVNQSKNAPAANQEEITLDEDKPIMPAVTNNEEKIEKSSLEPQEKNSNWMIVMLIIGFLVILGLAVILSFRKK
ncbi:copper resistance CopC family protein [Neobacillus drentensis]|uniref:copper resistance CopC family protein n=1 Tax=Neobacillus drentensis TaxID=220684 RepID=UPI0030026AAF